MAVDEHRPTAAVLFHKRQETVVEVGNVGWQ
jgi:hypothetical protein